MPAPAEWLARAAAAPLMMVHFASLWTAQEALLGQTASRWRMAALTTAAFL